MPSGVTPVAYPITQFPGRTEPRPDQPPVDQSIGRVFQAQRGADAEHHALGGQQPCAAGDENYYKDKGGERRGEPLSPRIDLHDKIISFASSSVPST